MQSRALDMLVIPLVSPAATRLGCNRCFLHSKAHAGSRVQRGHRLSVQSMGGKKKDGGQRASVRSMTFKIC